MFGMGEGFILGEFGEWSHGFEFEEIVVREDLKRRAKFGVGEAGRWEILLEENVAVQEIGAEGVLVPMA